MTYGDRGNVLTLARRAQWRGFKVEIAGVTRGEPFPDRTDLIVIGGGSDRVQSLIGDDLSARGQQLSQMVAGGTVILARLRWLPADGAELRCRRWKRSSRPWI